MKFTSLISQSAKNAFRSKSRTTLTVIAIFIGAFTLTITSGIGTGINLYIESSISSIGAKDTLSITKITESTNEDRGPKEFSESITQAQSSTPGPGGTLTVEAMTEEDFELLRGFDSVVEVSPNLPVKVEYLQGLSDTPYVVQFGSFIDGMELTLAAGAQLDQDASENQVAIAESYLEALGFDSAESALGETVLLGFRNFDSELQEVAATVVAVTTPGFGPGPDNAVGNTALKETIYFAQNDPDIANEAREYPSATLWFELESMTDEEIATLQNELEQEGYASSSTADLLGTFTAVIDVVVLILNAFAIIALLAAGFGIVNTLFMSVQERTREIGLMKAMGLGSSKVYTLFSLEAVIIGALGSLLGVSIGMGTGLVVSDVLSRSLFEDLAGLQLVAFDPIAVALVVFTVLGISFIAGTFPALKAARKDPIESLRYE